jgi:hypothetical protein
MALLPEINLTWALQSPLHGFVMNKITMLQLLFSIVAKLGTNVPLSVFA